MESKNNFFRGVVHGCLGVAVVAIPYTYTMYVGWSDMRDVVLTIIAYVIIALVSGKLLSLMVKGEERSRYIFGVVMALLLVPLVGFGACLIAFSVEPIKIGG